MGAFLSCISPRLHCQKGTIHLDIEHQMWQLLDERIIRILAEGTNVGHFMLLSQHWPRIFIES